MGWGSNVQRGDHSEQALVTEGTVRATYRGWKEYRLNKLPVYARTYVAGARVLRYGVQVSSELIVTPQDHLIYDGKDLAVLPTTMFQRLIEQPI